MICGRRDCMDKRPEFIDNLEQNTLANAIRLHLEYLEEKLAESPSVDIATSYFNPEGFFSIADHLEKIHRFRLLLGAEPRDKDRKKLRKPGQPKGEKYFAQQIDESLKSLDEDLINDRNLLGFTLKVDKSLQRLINYLKRENVEVRRYNRGFLHGKAYMFSYNEGVIAGSSNFTGAGLNSNLELNLGHYQPHVTEKVEEWFNRLWEKSSPYDLISLYEKRFEPFQPYVIYLRVLWERYHQELEDESLETGGRIELTTFQNDGVFRAKRFLKKFNGAIIADDVGLGKTFIAGKFIEEAVQNRRQRALVIAPASLRDGMWDKFQSEINTHFEILSFAELRDEVQLGGTTRRLKQDIGDYQLIVIDEAHAFRNPGTNQAQSLRTLLRGDPPKDLLLLTATPVNNSLWDFYYLIKYFIKHDAVFSNEGIRSLKERFKEAQIQDPSELSPNMLFDILDKTTVRRTRKFVKKYYKNDRIKKGEKEIIIKFPDIKPIRVDYIFEKIFDSAFFDDVAEGLAAGENETSTLSLARYRPSRYLLSKSTDGSELALIGLLRTGILKRFESSKEAFSKTLQRMIEQNEAALELLDKGIFPEPNLIEEWVESDNDEAFNEAFQTQKEFTLGPYDEEKLRNDLYSDVSILKRWKEKTDLITKESDPKLMALAETLLKILRKAKSDAIDEKEFVRNRKVIIFSYFEDTVEWILEFLQSLVEVDERFQCYKNRIVGISGDEWKFGISRENALYAFAPESTEAPEGTENKYDILVTTDVLSQGINLQDCRNVVNYDLPWNPMRIVQRNGRIDRIGSPHTKIYLYTFFPEDKLETLLELELRIRHKLTQAARSIGIEREVLPDIETVDRNFADTLEEIKTLRNENSELLERGGSESAAFSGEEFRQELRKGLKDFNEEITTLPWGAGSGFTGDSPGYFFCAKIGNDIFYRFIDHDKMEIIDETLTCLEMIQCTKGTQRFLPDHIRENVYEAWDKVRDDIFDQWQFQTDPKNIEPEIRPLFKKIADHLREFPPRNTTQKELEKLIESVEAPWGLRIEKELREVFKQDIEGERKSHELAAKIKDLGLQPYKAPEPLPMIEKDEIRLVCWLAIVPKEYSS